MHWWNVAFALMGHMVVHANYSRNRKWRQELLNLSCKNDNLVLLNFAFELKIFSFICYTNRYIASPTDFCFDSNHNI